MFSWTKEWFGRIGSFFFDKYQKWRTIINLPGWCKAIIKYFIFIGLSNLLHSDITRFRLINIWDFEQNQWFWWINILKWKRNTTPQTMERLILPVHTVQRLNMSLYGYFKENSGPFRISDLKNPCRKPQDCQPVSSCPTPGPKVWPSGLRHFGPSTMDPG